MKIEHAGDRKFFASLGENNLGKLMSPSDAYARAVIMDLTSGVLPHTVETDETSIACCDSPSLITVSKALCNLHYILDSSLTHSLKHTASYLVNFPSTTSTIFLEP